MWKKYTVCVNYVDSGLTFLTEKFDTSFEAAEFLYDKIKKGGENLEGNIMYREKYGAEPFPLDYDLKLVDGPFFWRLEGLYHEGNQDVEKEKVFFAIHVDDFKNSEKTMVERKRALENINDVFFIALDQYLNSDFIFDKNEIVALRTAHENAVNAIWRTGAIVID